MRYRLLTPSRRWLPAPAIAALMLIGCDAPGESRVDRDAFRDAAEETGLVFHHRSGEQGQRLFHEIMGAGAAIADFDGDGDLDVALIQSEPTPAGEPASRMFRNMLIETGRLSFEDVTQDARFMTRCRGTGASAADFDNDGDVDLYITCFGRNEFWINSGNGRFTEQATALGVDATEWSTASAWLDFDDDGHLDLWVGNYLNYSSRNHRTCQGPGGAIDYCGPQSFEATHDRLFRNTGSGFEDVTIAAGLASGNSAPALGAVIGDFDGRGGTDLYVANDGLPNALWLNQGGRFEDLALLAGVAVNSDGQAEASMGVDAGDYDGDGDDDLYMVHISDEKATLYARSGDGVFQDRSNASRLGPLTRGTTGFGTAWIDVDMDGWLDILIFNGHVRMENSAAAGMNAYVQAPLLLRNQGDGTFIDITSESGPALQRAAVSRGAAFGDLDNDGDLDVVVSNVDAAAWLLIGQADPGQHWIGVELIERGRTAHGARAGLEFDAHPTQWRRVRVDGSFAASNDPRLQFAVPSDRTTRALLVEWPDGTRSRVDADRLQLGKYTRIEREAITR